MAISKIKTKLLIKSLDIKPTKMRHLQLLEIFMHVYWEILWTPNNMQCTLKNLINEVVCTIEAIHSATYKVNINTAKEANTDPPSNTPFNMGTTKLCAMFVRLNTIIR